MNTRSAYPDIEVPEISLPGFVLDRADERGAAVPLTSTDQPDRPAGATGALAALTPGKIPRTDAADRTIIRTCPPGRRASRVSLIPPG